MTARCPNTVQYRCTAEGPSMEGRSRDRPMVYRSFLTDSEDRAFNGGAVT